MVRPVRARYVHCNASALAFWRGAYPYPFGQSLANIGLFAELRGKMLPNCFSVRAQQGFKECFR
jgi:hypothetical protein